MNAMKCVRSCFACCALAVIPSAFALTIDAFNPQPDSGPMALATQVDGKIIIGGQFQTVGTTPVKSIARLNADGSTDATFANPAVNFEVKAVAVQPDGKILIGGTFDAIGTSARHYLARLNANGTLDTNFVDPDLNSTVWAIAMQPDGKVLVAGSFTLSGATPRGRLARFNSDGTLDTLTFADPKICNSEAHSVALQANGDIVVGGFFAHIGNCSGSPYHFYLARFSSAGVLDSTFPVDPPPGPVGSGTVVGADGSIYVGGGYPTSDSLATRLVAKLSSSGALISAFDDLNNDGSSNSFVLQPNGKILIGGNFQQVGGLARHALARLNADGSLDSSFADPAFSLDANNPNGAIFGVAAQADGKVLAAGNFSLASAQSRQYMARVVSGNLATSRFTGQPSGSSVVAVWSRTGDGPELAQPPMLMHSSDGVNFAAVGPMTRIANGWQATAPFNVHGTPFYLQATGTTSGGAQTGSAGRVASDTYFSDTTFADGFE
ncbi:MAG: hypothetical protein ABIQ70_13570 [Dokdonella sp.]